MGQRLSEFGWPVLVSTVRLGHDRYRVVRPARVPAFAGPCEGRLGARFCLDRDSALLPAHVWGLAAPPHGFRDRLRWDVAADTLAATGSREESEPEAGQVRALAEEGPAHRARPSDAHCNAEIDMGRFRHCADRRRPHARLHAGYTR